jgi:hypothetical protein
VKKRLDSGIGAHFGKWELDRDGRGKCENETGQSSVKRVLTI